MSFPIDETVEYNPYEEGLSSGKWTQRNGSEIHVINMSEGHLRKALRRAELASMNATFSYDSDLFDEWADLFRQELHSRSADMKARTPKKATTRGAKQEMKCHCGAIYKARVADLKRGWALSCSKSCAAIRRDFGKPPAAKAEGGRDE